VGELVLAWSTPEQLVLRTTNINAGVCPKLEKQIYAMLLTAVSDS